MVLCTFANWRLLLERRLRECRWLLLLLSEEAAGVVVFELEGESSVAMVLSVMVDPGRGLHGNRLNGWCDEGLLDRIFLQAAVAELLFPLMLWVCMQDRSRRAPLASRMDVPI